MKLDDIRFYNIKPACRFNKNVKEELLKRQNVKYNSYLVLVNKFEKIYTVKQYTYLETQQNKESMKPRKRDRDNKQIEEKASGTAQSNSKKCENKQIK